MGSSVLHIKKDRLKFSSAHMTVFADGKKEALHGHNYTVELSVGVLDTSLQKMVPFSVFKKAAQSICDAWDERVLLPELCPFLKKGKAGKGETEFTLCKKRYVLPSDEVVWLEIDNVTSETLAQVFIEELIECLSKSLKGVTSLNVRIEESPGQGASYRLDF